jgi:membrane protein insertase Oxa1/YidC/SpoIIIJ
VNPKLLRPGIRSFVAVADKNSHLRHSISLQAESWGVDESHAYDPSVPVDMFQTSAVAIHDFLGISWAETLALMTLAFRLVTLPLYIGSIAIGQRRARAAKELVELRIMAKEAVLLRDKDLLNGIDMEYKRRLTSLGLSSNPLQGLGYFILAQLPWTTVMLFSVKGMATQASIFTSFGLDSKFLWCDSLALADPYGILPLLSTAAVAVSPSQGRTHTTESRENNDSASHRDARYIKYALHGATFAFLPFAMQLPSGMLVCFLVNTIFSRLVSHLVRRYILRERR